MSTTGGRPGQRKRPKTWSGLATGARRKPSAYEVVSHDLNYHYRRTPAPFELDPRTPLNRWYMTYREESPFWVDDWNEFRDPRRLTYTDYVKQQNRRETYLDGVVDRFEGEPSRAALSADWVELLGRVYLPSRFSCHVLQMCAMYLAQISPSSYVTNCAEFQAGDEMRRIQRLAYRAVALGQQFGGQLSSSEASRAVWEKDTDWQPARRCLEELLVAYDWGECFVALNLCVKPMHDAFFVSVLSDIAAREGDEELALTLDDLDADRERNKEWTQALVDFAIERRPENRAVIEEWIDAWRPRAESAVGGLAAMVEGRASVADAFDVRRRVGEMHGELLEGCGLGSAARL